MKLKNVLLTGLSFVLVAALAVGGTLAYLTDSDSDVNVMTVGNVSIEQHEYERVVDENGDWVTSEYTGYGYTADKMQEFTQGKPALPAVYQDGDVKWDDRNGNQNASGEGSHQQPWSQIGAPGSNQLFDGSVKNVIDKFVFVENTGKTDAYYRTIIAIECPEGLDPELIHSNINTNSRFDWENLGYATIDGVKYLLKVATYNQILTPGEISRPSLLQLFLDPSATNEDCATFGDTWEVLVVSQAVQADGFKDAETALNEAFYDVTTENHPWVNAVIAEDLGITEAGTYELNGDVYTIDSAYFHTQKVTGDVTINGNGSTVLGVATSEDAFQWEGGTIPNMSAIFSSENGSTVTVSDLTFEGTMSAIMLGHYKIATYNNYNTVLNNVDVVGTEVVSFSSNISPAVCVYGTATLNNCNIYGTTLSSLDTDPMWPVYDLAVVNYSNTTINGGKIGSIYTWTQAILTIDGAEVDSILTATGTNKGMLTVKAGSNVGSIVANNSKRIDMTIENGATVGTIDFSSVTDKSQCDIIIEDGANVGQIVANGKTYASVQEWKGEVSSVAELDAVLSEGGNITLTADINITKTEGLKFTEDTVLNLNGYNITAAGDALVAESGTLVINGEGTVTAGDGGVYCAVWANGGNVVINGGTYVGSSDADGVGNDTIYTSNGGTVEINGGEYFADRNTESYGDTQYTCLNEKDNNRGTITVKGGTFHRFSPAYNWSEGKGTNYLAEGYTIEKSQQDGHYVYVVKKAN